MTYNTFPKIFRIVILISLFLVGLPGADAGLAQSTTDPWTPPVNLSKSGSTTNPSMVVDASGVVHVIWQDEIDGMVYSRTVSDEWSDPVPVDLPFEDEENTTSDIVNTPPPQLLADQLGFVHAFWLGDEDELLYSRVTSDSIEVTGAWTSAQAVAESAVAFDIAIEEGGIIHLSYLRSLETEDFPAGIYYRKSIDSGLSWTNGLKLYESPYFRSSGNNDSNVQIDINQVGEIQEVYIGWDNRPLKRIFFARSEDGGETWGEHVEVDGPSPTSVTTNPFNILVRPNNMNIVIIWQAGLQSDFNCTQYYQYSQDNGQSWSERQVMLKDFVGCPQGNRFFRIGDDLDLLQISVQDQVYYLAWNGSEWSEPQLQTTLSTFLDQETLEAVNLRCLQTVMHGSDKMNAVGCNIVGNADIWYTNRLIGSVTEWFPPPSNWIKPVAISESITEITFPVSIADRQGRFHLFWVQAPESDNPETKRQIFYTRNEAENWTQPAGIINSPDGDPAHLQVAVDAIGRLLIVWSDSLSGDVYFSWADSSLAASIYEWIKPIVLPAPPGVKASPDILVNNDGVIQVVYSIPLNEGRGIYLVESVDHGLTWSEPMQVFDAAAENWSMVDVPLLTQTNNANLHLLLTRQSLPGLLQENYLYYMQSFDNGLTWTEPAIVSEQSVKWNQIVGLPLPMVHRFWESVEGESTNLLHDFSADDGANWSPLATLTKFGEVPGPTFVVVDYSENLHLLEIASLDSGEQVLNHRAWDGASWVNEEGLELENVGENIATNLTTAISPDWTLAVFYTSIRYSESGLPDSYQLYYTGKVLHVKEIPAKPESPETSFVTPGTPEATQLTPTETLAPSELVTPTPTADLSIITHPENQGGNSIFNRPSAGLYLAGALAILVVGVVLVIGWLAIRWGRRN